VFLLSQIGLGSFPLLCPGADPNEAAIFSSLRVGRSGP
jgi:hypothetical protein